MRTFAMTARGRATRLLSFLPMALFATAGTTAPASNAHEGEKAIG